MTQQDRKTWAAVTYPEMPAQLSPEALARRSYVRIGVRVAKIALPVMLAGGFAAIAGGSGGDGSGSRSAPPYPGAKLALSVRLQLSSQGLLPPGMDVDCDDSAASVGSVASCYEYTRSLDDDNAVSFPVRFDGQGRFSFTTPDGDAVKGKLVS